MNWIHSYRVTTFASPILEISGRVGKLAGGGGDVTLQSGLAGLAKQFVSIGKGFASGVQSGEGLREQRWIKGAAALFRNQSNGAAQEGRIDEAGDALRVVIHESIEPNLAPAFAVEQGDVVER